MRRSCVHRSKKKKKKEKEKRRKKSEAYWKSASIQTSVVKSTGFNVRYTVSGDGRLFLPLPVPVQLFAGYRVSRRDGNVDIRACRFPMKSTRCAFHPRDEGVPDRACLFHVYFHMRLYTVSWKFADQQLTGWSVRWFSASSPRLKFPSRIR